MSCTNSSNMCDACRIEYSRVARHIYTEDLECRSGSHPVIMNLNYTGFAHDANEAARSVERSITDLFRQNVLVHAASRPENEERWTEATDSDSPPGSLSGTPSGGGGGGCYLGPARELYGHGMGMPEGASERDVLAYFKGAPLSSFSSGRRASHSSSSRCPSHSPSYSSGGGGGRGPMAYYDRLDAANRSTAGGGGGGGARREMTVLIDFPESIAQGGEMERTVARAFGSSFDLREVKHPQDDKCLHRLKWFAKVHPEGVPRRVASTSSAAHGASSPHYSSPPSHHYSDGYPIHPPHFDSGSSGRHPSGGSDIRVRGDAWVRPVRPRRRGFPL